VTERLHEIHKTYGLDTLRDAADRLKVNMLDMPDGHDSLTRRRTQRGQARLGSVSPQASLGRAQFVEPSLERHVIK
jgi:hypothetical protein